MQQVKKRKRRKQAENKPEGEARLATRFAKGTAQIMAVGVIVGVLFFGGRLGLAHAMELEYFDVKRITVAGKRQVSKKDIMNLIGPLLGKNIFKFDLEEMGERIKTHPWIKDVEIRRELPSELTLRLIERKPVGYVKAKGGVLWLMDSEGVLLEQVKKEAVEGMIIFTGLKIDKTKAGAGYGIGAKNIRPALNTATLLKGYKLLGKKSISRIDLADQTKLTVFFGESEIALITPRYRWTDEVERLKVVDYILRKKTGDIKSIDLTFKNTVIVTYPEV